MSNLNVGSKILNGILCIFLPSLSVAMVTGCNGEGDVQILVNVILWVTLWVPAVFHGWWIIATWDANKNRQQPQIKYVLQPVQKPGSYSQQQLPQEVIEPLPNVKTQPAEYSQSEQNEEHSLPTYNESQATTRKLEDISNKDI